MTIGQQRERLVWIDHARAAGILLVVAGHAVLSLERSAIPADLGLLRAVETAIYAFHMPLFFILAGMTHGLARPTGVAGMARSLAWTIVVPYAIWSLVWIGLKMAFPGAANAAVAIASPWEILWRPVDHFWFLYVLLLVRIAWFAVDATGSRLVRHLAVALPLAVAFIGVPPMDGIFTPWLLFWASFYGIGVLLGPSIGRLAPQTLAGIVAVGAALWAGALFGVPDLLEGGTGVLRTLVAIGGSLAVLAAAALIRGGFGPVSRLVGFIGEASLAIFLTHTIIGATVRLVLRRLDMLTAETFLVFAILFGVALPAVAYLAVLRLGARLGLPLARYVGFGTARNSAYYPVAARPEPLAGPTPAV